MYDIIIVGAGTAGMTAALYALRAGRSVLILEKETIGGQISFTPKIENYPGIMHISGAEFSSSLFDQIERLGVEFDIATVKRIVMTKETEDNLHKCSSFERFLVYTEDKTFETKSVIIASGVKPRKLAVAREEELFGEGVCYCAVCDGAFYKDKKVAVCGGGNSAVTDALFLSAYCAEVTLIHRRSKFKAEKTLIDKLKSKNNVKIMLESEITELIGKPSLTTIKIIGTEGKSKEIAVDALFVAIGHSPDNSAFSDIVMLDENGFIVANDDCKTNVEGIFAAGDCRTKSLRQLTTATADGATAGLAACTYADSKH